MVATLSPTDDELENSDSLSTDRRARPGGRSARVVNDVLQATLDELARVGYGALRIDDVAVLARVNKTTVYRRWATKSDLVRAALLARVDEQGPLPNTGALRSDMLALVERAVALKSEPSRRSILRVLLLESTEPELAAITSSLRERHHAETTQLVKRAIERGELPAGTDPSLLLEPLHGVLYRRLCLLEEPLDKAFTEQLVDVLIAGVRVIFGPARNA